MSRNLNVAQTKKVSPSNHKYDQSSYIVLKEPVRREAATGRFVETKSNTNKIKKK